MMYYFLTLKSDKIIFKKCMKKKWAENVKENKVPMSYCLFDIILFDIQIW